MLHGLSFCMALHVGFQMRLKTLQETQNRHSRERGCEPVGETAGETEANSQCSFARRSVIHELSRTCDTLLAVASSNHIYI